MEVVSSMLAQNAIDLQRRRRRKSKDFWSQEVNMSDCNGRQNSFLFPDENVRNFILPQLNEEKMERAHLPLGINLNNDPNLHSLCWL